VLICDGFIKHETLEILKYFLANKIILCRLASSKSHKLQPYDISTFTPLKAAYCDQFEQLERRGVINIGEEQFTSLYYPAKRKVFTPKNIQARFTAYGLVPFNRDRVLRQTPKLPDLIIPEATGVDTVPRQANTVLPQDETLQSPQTLVLVEGVMSLHRLIIEQYSHALKRMNKRHL
jgi:hypothetical protein